MIPVYFVTVVARRRWVVEQRGGIDRFYGQVSSFREDDALVAGSLMATSDAVAAVDAMAAPGGASPIAVLQRPTGSGSALLPPWLEGRIDASDFVVWDRASPDRSTAAMPAPNLGGTDLAVDFPALLEDLRDRGLALTTPRGDEPTTLPAGDPMELQLRSELGWVPCACLSASGGRTLTGLLTFAPTNYGNDEAARTLVPTLREVLSNHGAVVELTWG